MGGPGRPAAIGLLQTAPWLGTARRPVPWKRLFTVRGHLRLIVFGLVRRPQARPDAAVAARPGRRRARGPDRDGGADQVRLAAHHAQVPGPDGRAACAAAGRARREAERRRAVRQGGLGRLRRRREVHRGPSRRRPSAPRRAPPTTLGGPGPPASAERPCPSCSPSTPARPACARRAVFTRRSRPRSRPTGSSRSTSPSPAGSSTTRPRSGTPCKATLLDVLGAARTSRSPPSASPTSARRWWRGTAARASRCTGRSSGRTGAPRPAATSCAEAGHLPLVRERTGLVLDPYFCGTKMAWLLTPEGGVAGRAPTWRSGTIDTWLLWNLTGGEVHCHRPDQRQPHDAVRHRRAGVERRAVRRCSACPLDALPEVRPSSGRFGVTVGPLRRPGGHPRVGHRRRPAGGAVRPGLLRARDGEEHLRHRQLRAHERRPGLPAAGRGPAHDGGLDAGRRLRPPTRSRARSS